MVKNPTDGMQDEDIGQILEHGAGDADVGCFR